MDILGPIRSQFRVHTSFVTRRHNGSIMSLHPLSLYCLLPAPYWIHSTVGSWWPPFIPLYFIRLTCPCANPILGDDVDYRDRFCLTTTTHSFVRCVSSVDCRGSAFPPLISLRTQPHPREVLTMHMPPQFFLFLVRALSLIRDLEGFISWAPIKSFPPNYHPFQCQHNGLLQGMIQFSSARHAQRPIHHPISIIFIFPLSCELALNKHFILHEEEDE